MNDGGVLIIVSAIFMLALIGIPIGGKAWRILQKDQKDVTLGEFILVLFLFAAIFMVVVECLPRRLAA
jgi:hypothetical protein